MAYKKDNNYSKKTEAEWDEIRYKREIPIRIGGYFHDASQLVSNGYPADKKNIEHIKKWIDALWEIAEDKKRSLLDRTISTDQAESANKEFAQKMNANQQLNEEIKDGEVNEINNQLQMETEELDEDIDTDRKNEPF